MIIYSLVINLAMIVCCVVINSAMIIYSLVINSRLALIIYSLLLNLSIGMIIYSSALNFVTFEYSFHISVNSQTHFMFFMVRHSMDSRKCKRDQVCEEEVIYRV